MRIVFAGTPAFARQALDALLQAGHEIVLVMTQPDRPSGRGLKLTPSPVKQAALAAQVPVEQPLGLRLDGPYAQDAARAQSVLQELAPDLMVVAAYGLILPQWTLSLPKYGCLNIHASLLPRWRGAAPIQRAIEAGDHETGITIIQMDEGLDTGDMLLRTRLPITADHNATRLQDELAVQGAQAIVEAVRLLEQGKLQPQAQPEHGVSYANKLSKAESPLDFSDTAVVLERRIRAFDPVPGCSMALPGMAQNVKVWRAHALPASAPGALPGQVLQANARGIDVLTADGILRITELQKAGGKRQPVDAFIQGWRLPTEP